MIGEGAALVSALWLGTLTSLSPCPLAANIAAVSFLSKKIEHPRMVFFCGAAYIFGRMTAYALLGAAIIVSLVNVPPLAFFLQTYFPRIMGPVLIITGLVLLDVVTFRLPSFVPSCNKQEQCVSSGAGGAFLLGTLCALSFCPVSAALFFGSLIPLALQSRFGMALPFIYGVGTGIPVAGCAFVLTLGVTGVSRLFSRVSSVERRVRKVTAIIFIAAGCYFVWTYLVSLLF